MYFEARCSTQAVSRAAAAVLVALACLGTEDALTGMPPRARPRLFGNAPSATRSRGWPQPVRAQSVRHPASQGRHGPGLRLFARLQGGATWDWNEDLVAGWIGAPGLMVPGTAMGIFQGVAQSDRDDIVAYLATQQ